MAQNILEGVHVLDGGFATELERGGYAIDGSLWSARALAEAPDAVVAVHLDYLRAGAGCLLTASYQASARGFAEANGLAMSKAREMAGWALRRSVELAREAVARYQAEAGRMQPVLVAASLGPYGAALHNGAEFHGNYAASPEEIKAFHRERIAALAGHPDLLAFETVPSLDEAALIVEVLGEFPEALAWISFTCRGEHHTAHGEPIGECAHLLNGARQVVAVGINCTPPALVLSLLEQCKQESGKPLVVYPNSGEQWDRARRQWCGVSSVEDYERMTSEWFRAGAHMVGGCCRTRPAHIEAVARAARDYFAKNE